MSKNIVCHECHSENAPGSKFCSNCGARLGDGSERICPVCQTPNPQNRYYCDNCGTRLIQDDFTEQEKEPAEPGSQSADVFSLPTREPGDTGELDPSQLPEWLRTGTSPLEIDDADIKQVTESGRLPNIEGLTPEKRSTEDLPEWLVSEFDSDPIIEPPRSISTDHYLALVNRAKVEDSEPVQEDVDVSGAELPEWLVDSSKRGQAADARPAGSETEPDTDEHLASLERPDFSAGEAEEGEPSAVPSPEEGTPDWLAELGPLNTDLLSSPIDEGFQATSEISLDEEALPDWIDELGPPDTTMLSEPLKKLTGLLDEGVIEQEGVDDWLADFDAVDAHLLSLSGAETLEEPEPPPGQLADQDLGGSVAESVASSLQEGPLESSDESEAFPEEPTPTADAMDGAAVYESGFQESDAFPSWLDSPGAIELGLPLDAPSTQEEDVATLPGEGSAQLPDWIVEAEQFLDEKSTVEDDEVTGGFQQVPSESEEALPAWLQNADDATAEDIVQVGGEFAEPAFEDAAIGEPEEATDEFTDWVGELDLTGVDMLPEEAQVDDLVGDLTLADEELAGWMEEMDPAGTGFLAAKAEQIVADFDEQVPVAEDIGGLLEEADETAEERETALEHDEAPMPVSEPDEVDSESVGPWLAEPDGGLPPAEIDEMDELLAALQQLDEAQAEPELDRFLRVQDSGPEEESAEEDAISAEGEPIGRDRGLAGVDEAILADVPDWLSELGALDLDTSGVEPSSLPLDEEEFLPEALQAAKVDEESAAGAAEEPIQEEELDLRTPVLQAERFDSDWQSGDTILDELPDDEDLPDWLDQLAIPGSDQEFDGQVPMELASTEDLPEWVASLRPSTEGDAGSLLPTPLAFSPDDDTAFDEIAGGLGAPELPEWLRDETISAKGARSAASASEEAMESTSWFRPDDADAIEQAFSFDSDSDVPADSEWSNVLSELPRAVAPEKLLIRADIPEWIQKLKPKELSEDEPAEESDREVLTNGPLAGLAGVVVTESAIAYPQAASPMAGFDVTREQQQQAALLRRITQWEQPTKALAPKTATAASGVLRFILAVLLIAAILLGTYLPDLIQAEPPAPGSELSLVAEAVSEAAGEPVLVAVEYTPALAGELNTHLETLLSQIRANGSPIILVSQHAAGIAVARGQLQEQDDAIARFIPGEAIGLRRLASCIDAGSECPDMFGRALESDLQAALRQVSLVVVVTGDRDSLVNWIEQVGTTTEAKLLAGVTQSLTPLAMSYRNSGQLSGLIGGKVGIASYQRTIDVGEVSEEVKQQLSAQGISQLVVALVLIVGAVGYGFANRNSKRKGSISSAI